MHPRTVDAVRAIARTARLLERASDELSLADYRALAILRSGEERASRLAERLAVGKPAISATVDSLVRRGLIRRSSVEGDARATRLEVTDEGDDVFSRMEGRMTRQLELLAERSDSPERLVESIAALGDALDVALDERRARAAAAGAGAGATAEASAAASAQPSAAASAEPTAAASAAAADEVTA